jgi:hypothetical protein
MPTSGEASRIESKLAWWSPYEGPTPEVPAPRWPKFGLQIKRFPKRLIDLLPYLPYQNCFGGYILPANALRGSVAAYFRPPTPVTVAVRSSIPDFR